MYKMLSLTLIFLNPWCKKKRRFYGFSEQWVKFNYARHQENIITDEEDMVVSRYPQFWLQYQLAAFICHRYLLNAKFKF